jgi:hypothetical protein
MNGNSLTTKAREVYLESTSRLDEPTRVALAAARRRALASSTIREPESVAWWPVGAAAAAVMLAAMIWTAPQSAPEAYQASLDETGLQELMALGQELGLGDEEPALYDWLDHP